MPTHEEIEARFWKALKSDMTVMLGLAGGGATHAQPMTAKLFEEQDGRGPIWFFTSKQADLVRELGNGGPATLQFASKGHDLFAAIEGELSPANNPETIDRLWNKWVAAWFEGGRDDPKLQLLRFDPGHAQIWLNENSLFAGVRMMLGSDPKQDYKDKVAEIAMGE